MTPVKVTHRHSRDMPLDALKIFLICFAWGSPIGLVIASWLWNW